MEDEFIIPVQHEELLQEIIDQENRFVAKRQKFDLSSVDAKLEGVFFLG